MQNELDIVRDISTKLDAARIGYMLTGSMAMNYCAEPRMTREIDVVVALAPPDAATIVRVFGSDYYVSPEAVEESIRDEAYIARWTEELQVTNLWQSCRA